MTGQLTMNSAADRITDPVRWGIIGPGAIAGWFAQGVEESTSGLLVAVGSRTQEKADRFGKEFNVPRCFVGYDALLADPDVDAVYVATPHPAHMEWVIKAAEAGKHILVEKPIGMNLSEAERMIEAARTHDVFLMEAFMYRCHPLAATLAELIREGAVGDVRLIHSHFGYHSQPSPTSRAFAMELGGGGILDVGCYPASMSRLLAGAAVGKPFDEPEEVKACGHLGSMGADEWAVASVKFGSGICAQLSCAVRVETMKDSMLRVFGSKGMLEVADPWQASRFNRNPTVIRIRRSGESEPEEILLEAPRMLYTYEVDTVGENIPNRQAPAMTWDDTLGNMRLLDRWRAEVGLVYDMEKGGNSPICRTAQDSR
ncbi:MAG: Gfo/Idh/MocA family oxidoreductase [Armatimonadota bacterium]|nr:Gfo/Idh/MocA family oxidoreductase [Armatimonadota bacterium]